MLHIILTILKILGIILLVLSGIVLAVLLSVPFYSSLLSGAGEQRRRADRGKSFVFLAMLY